MPLLGVAAAKSAAAMPTMLIALAAGGQDDDVDSIGSGGGQDDDPEVTEVPPPPPPGNYADTPPINMSGFSRATPKFPFIIGFHSLLQALIPSNPMLYLRRRVRL